MTDDLHSGPRRRFLRQLAGAAGALLPAVAAPPAAAFAGTGAAAAGLRLLTMHHTHTGERIEQVYARGDQYLPEALGSLNRFLRDHYSGDVGRIDPALFDLLHRVHRVLGLGDQPGACFEVISGYRSPATNQLLRKTRGGGVASHSLHLQGQAIDVRLAGVPLADLRDAALSLKAGGVGYYPREQFVHLDTGRVRRW
ncbi:MAG: DUF882 domain-containing protein [Gammaproteobacteria bacterium]|jgi:uncharacterized protein YcbK (DUF882 family)|nr:DUF882 domain-containing protein [Gammaproteobacteria bacterium]